MFLTSPVLCVFLLSCFTEKIELEECPKQCECYSAPKENTLTNDGQTYSMICDVNGKFPDKLQMQSLAKYTLNTIAFKAISVYDIMLQHYLDNLTVSNIVFENSDMRDIAVKPMSEGNHNTFHVNSADLKVLTFINCQFRTTGSQFNWTVFHALPNLQAIHIEDGLLPALDHIFEPLSAGNVLTATIKNTQLCSIVRGVFAKWKKLRMLKITRNRITDLDWIRTLLPQLWFLDLRHNLINQIDHNILEFVPALKVLKLDFNIIKVMSYNTVIQPLLLRLREFTFEGMMFCANPEMSWTSEHWHDNSVVRYPLFYEHSLIDTYCQELDDKDLPKPYNPPLCYKLMANEFQNDICKNILTIPCNVNYHY